MQGKKSNHYILSTDPFSIAGTYISSNFNITADVGGPCKIAKT
jgi:hypothetical protein